MDKKPWTVYALILLWLAMCTIFISWGSYTLNTILDIPSWIKELPTTEKETLISIVHFVYLMSTIVWFVFSAIFILFAYGTFKRDHWAYSSGIIFSTIFLAIFGLMLATFMVNLLVFQDSFSTIGLITTMITFLVDLGIVFLITRPATKIYFDVEENKKIT